MAEYKMLREEIRTRVKFGHGVILWATLLILPAVLGSCWINSVRPEWLLDYLLAIGPIWPLLAFNYQANLRTIGSAAFYSDRLRRKALPEDDPYEQESSSWDRFFGRRRTVSRFAGAMLGTPLVLPPLMVIGFTIDYVATYPYQSFEVWSLAIINIALCSLSFVGFGSAVDSLPP